jgi:hypothetical protein
MLRLRTLFGAALLVLAGSALLLAQNGSISGTVEDNTGAVIQGAEITVHSLDTGATRTATSTGVGSYTITDLPAGAYEVTVKSSGFKTFHVTSIPLTVAQVLTVNAKLETGAVTEEVQVQANQIQDVDLETSQVSNLVDQKQMVALPLITRDPYSLVLLSPGASQTDSTHGGFTVNGARDRNNNFLLDGADNNDTSVPGGSGGLLSINPDSAEEFRVITDNFNAEFGRNNGAIIDVITKSGTNAFHGGIYEFGRWNGFGGARDYFNRASDGPMNPYVRNQFGGRIGGPIVKNKTFFFFNDELDRFRTTLTNVATVPTAPFKTGKFTYIDNNGGSHPVDLTPTGAQNPAGLPLDPTMQKVFALYPKPTVDNGDGFTGTLFFPSTSATNSYNTVAKIDHHFNDRHTLSLRYGYDHFFDPNPSHSDILPGIGAFAEKAINEGATGKLTSTLSNTLVNDFQFGWNHVYATFYLPKSVSSVLDSPGGVDQFGNGRDYIMNPFTNFGSTVLAADGQFRKTGTVSYSEALSWVHGSNTFKFGFDFRDIGESGADNFDTRRQVTTDAVFLFGTDLGLTNFSGPPGTLEPIQDAALALWGFSVADHAAEFFNKSGTRLATNNKLFRQHEFDWFGQDTWKVRRNLTLTLGLRYQLNGVPYEENGNFSNLLQDPGSFAHGQPVVFTVVGPGTGKQMFKNDYSDIEPRVGFSWDPWSDGKTSIRGAFGIFHDRIFGNWFGNARGLPPFEQDYSSNPLDTINNAFSGPANPAFPAVPPQQKPSTMLPDGSLLQLTTILDTHFRNPTANNWNFGFQHEFRGNNVLEASYVGSMGVHVWSHRDGNPPNPALVQQLVAFCSNPNNSFTNPNTIANFGGPNSCVPSDVRSGNLYDGFEFGTLPFDAVNNNALFQPAFQQTEFNSIYHGLQSKFTHRFSRGLQVQGSYTWSHAIDDGVDPLGAAVGAHSFPRNSLNIAENRGNSDNDVRHVGVINYIWEVPIGRGKTYMSGGVLGKVLEGFEISGITTIQSGNPFTVRSALDSQRTGISAWGLQTGDPFAPTPAGCKRNPVGGKAYISNLCSFVEPPFGSAGSERNSVYGPGFWNFNAVIAKKTRLTERVELETRFEGYNIFNHQHFLNPNIDSTTLLESSQFGQITSTFTEPDGTTSARQIQVAMKLNF